MGARGKTAHIGLISRTFSHFSSLVKIVFLGVIGFILWQIALKHCISGEAILDGGNYQSVISCPAPTLIKRLVWVAAIIFFIGLVVYILTLSFRRNLAAGVRKVMAEQRGGGALVNLVGGSPKVAQLAKEFQASPMHYDYIVFRKACHTAQVFLLPFLTQLKLPRIMGRQEEHGLLHALNDIIISQTAITVDCRVMPQFGEGPYFGDAITDWEGQKTAYHDGRDLPLRFQQATPHFRFTSDKEERGQLPKSKYIFFVCLANPIRDAIQITTLKDVLTKMKDRHTDNYDKFLADLQNPVYPFFSTLRVDEANQNAFLPFYSEPRSILRVDESSPSGFRSGFDVNKLDRDKFEGLTPLQRQSLQAFYGAINDSLDEATDICLKGGDILLINNYYTFHRRKELRYRVLNRFTIFPRRRWLRVYYTFPGYTAEEWRSKGQPKLIQKLGLPSGAAELRGFAAPPQ